MQIELNEVTVADLSKDYKDDAENGVTAYGGKLDIRPPYQREFIYKDKQREAVIDTVLKGFYMRFDILHLKRIIVTAYNSDTCNGGRGDLLGF